ncbi:MAG: PEP-CTERM sorting domain-containing protein [bacterium]
MRSRIAALALTMSLGFAAPASASTQFTFVNGGSVTAFGYYVGQYNGIEGAPVNSNVILNCVDFFHHISNGDVWQANLTSLGSSTGIGTVTRFNNLTAYREAAYLTTQYAGKTNSQIGDIQATIWNLFSGSSTPPTPSTSVWGTAAAAYVAANPNGSTYQNFWVVTDVNARLASGADNPNSLQEFIIYDDKFNPNVTPTPEPATLMLVATGFVGIAGLRLRRKKK